ncbi:NgrE [Xenorhabdus sp. KJ12.1]|nr:NgrE [Xenorhabdus sp. KJ12.1]
MIVTVSEPCISQLYMSHLGHVASRQSWSSGKEYQDWYVQYSSANKPSATDIGAFSSSGGKVAGIVHADNWIMGKELWEKDPNSGKEERAYSPFNKPSASDVGAIANHEVAYLGDGSKFQDCLSSGFYKVGISNITTVVDAPVGLYNYGVLEVQNSNGVIAQRYISHSGQIAVRQSWDDGASWLGWNIVYSSTFKPSAADIGALPIIGGQIDGEVHANRFWSKTSLNLGEGTWGERHGILISGKDDANFENNNLEILSWYGIGLKSTLDNKTRIFFNPRDGYIGTQGSINSENLLAKSNVCIGDTNHGMWDGGKDAASFEGNNLEIRSWYGIGLKATTDNETRIIFNTRNGDIGTKGGLLVGANSNGALKIYSHDTAKSQVFFYTFGDTHNGGNRNVVLEAADDKGWLWYSQRLTSDQIQFAVNGQIIPNDYSNFDTRYIQDIRFGSVEHSAIWMGSGYSDTPPYVITAVINDGNNEPDTASRRPLQKLINGTWHNIGAL